MASNKQTLWSDLSLSDKICCFIAYASVFNDVIKKSDLTHKLDIDQKSIGEAISVLIEKRLIIERDGYLGLKHLELKISKKESDYVISHELITRQWKVLKFIGRLPLIDFVGISGSVAAKNPVATEEKVTDIDIFIITANHCIWIVGIFAAIFRNLTRRKYGHLCINHIWDGSDLSVYNRNFYVAHEIYHLIPVLGKTTYNQFLLTNKWVTEYFPNLKPPAKTKPRHKTGIGLINRLFYFLFTLFRCLKNFSTYPLKDLFNSDPTSHINFKRRGAENGGYQQMIQRKFNENIRKYFPLMDAEAIEEALFHDDLSQKIRHSPDFKFSHRLRAKEQINWTINYAKYQTDLNEKAK